MKDYLVKNGIDPKRIILKYNGEANPKFDNRTPEGRAANRRVEIRLIPNLPDATNE
jgi:outer membrane protein OmpA-like peptidoglycan-associated protein